MKENEKLPKKYFFIDESGDAGFKITRGSSPHFVVAMVISTLVEGYRWSPLAIGGALLAMAGLVVALSARKPST